MQLKHILVTLTLCTLASYAQARDFTVGELSVKAPWARALPPVSANGAAYLDIVNHAMNGDRLLSGSSPIAARVEFHTHVKHGAMMMMQKLDAVDIPAHATVTMAPGGMHVMLLEMRKPLTVGTSFPLTLTFERAGTTTVTVMVEAQPPTPNAPAMEHGKHTN